MHFSVTKNRTQQSVCDSLPTASARQAVARLYRSLLRQWGPQNWWPAESQFEIIVGAILTQNTAWTNVERAMANLRQAGMLTPESIRLAERTRLEELLRPSGYFRQKTERLQNLITFILTSYKEDGAPTSGEHPAIACWLRRPTAELRRELLEQKGVGPETADSILLYAGNHPVFVVDAYTRRVFERHGLIEPGTDYETIRLLVESSLQSPAHEPGSAPNHSREPEAPGKRPASKRIGKDVGKQTTGTLTIHTPSAMSSAVRPALVQHYNEFHALLVQTGKHYCLKKAPNCAGCPLAKYLSAGPIMSN